MLIKLLRHLIFSFAITISATSCAVHDYFPFICFERGCVKNQFGTGGLKKRIKGTVFLMKRKINKKQNDGLKDKYKEKEGTESDTKNSQRKDSSEIKRGRNVDYTKFYILFKLKADTSKFDTICVVHSSEYKTLIETDQSRLDAKLDSIKSNQIVVVYIKEYPNQPAPRSDIKKRDKALRKYLHHSGITPSKIKLIKQPVD